MKIFHGVKFLWFCNGYNRDERLEHLVYDEVSGEPGIASCSHRSDIYLKGRGGGVEWTSAHTYSLIIDT